MFQGDDEPKDWEMKEEEPPQPLKEKWARDAILGPETIVCPFCKNRVSADNMHCLYCGARVLRRVGFLSGLFVRIKSFFGK